MLMTSELDSSPVSENALPVVQGPHCDSENDTGDKIHVPSNKALFHWDLNTVPDECEEEPCFGSPPSILGNCADGILNVNGDSKGFGIGILVYNTEITSKKSDVVNLFAPPTSSTSSLVEQDDLIRDSKGQGVVQGSAADNITNDLPESADPMTLVTQGHAILGTEEVGEGVIHCQKSCKVLDDDNVSQNGCNVSEIIQDEQKLLADGDNIMNVQKDNDSPIEDGEFIKSPAHDLEENKVEKWETECADIEFDDEYEDDFDKSDLAVSENNGVDHDDNQALVKTSSPGNDMIKRVEDASSKPSSLRGLKTPERDQPSSGKKLFTVYTKRHRSSDVGESYSQTNKVFGSEKIMGRERLPFQGRARNEADYRWVDDEPAGGNRDSRINYGYKRSRNANGDFEGKPSRQSSHDYGPSDLRSLPNRRQSPTERKDSYPFHSRRQRMRKFSPKRSRDRSGSNFKGFRRGPWEDYHEPGPYYSERKERRSSPNFSRDSHNLKTHKRSRSRSSIEWNMDNRGRKWHNPEFRTEDRVQGERPFQKRNFSGDFDQGRFRRETVTAYESEGSSVSENALPVVQNLHCDNENDTGMKIDTPPKDVRFHWDLNTEMDEWEEPFFSPPPNTQETCAEGGIGDGGPQFQKMKKESCGTEILASDANKLDMVKCFAPPTSFTSTFVGQADVIGQSRGQGVVQGTAGHNITNELPKIADPMTKGHVTLVNEEVGEGDFHRQKSCKVLVDNKLASENPQNDCNGSEVFHDEQMHPADDNIMKIQGGYEYEEGELREPLVHVWEENSMEGSSPLDYLQRRAAAYMKRRRSDDFGSEKMMGRDKLPFQGHVRNEADCRGVDSAGGDWDSRNVNDGKSSSHDYGPRRQDSYPLHSRRRPMREFSRERSRDRSGFDLQGFRRGHREDYYHEPGPAYYSERKEGRYSPKFNLQTHKRSRSRSAWNMDKRDRKWHNSRYFDDGKCTDGRYRERRSSSPPGRMFKQSPLNFDESSDERYE